MNLFATDPCPEISARNLDDKRVVKMVTETAQMICTIAAGDGVKNLPMKPTHANHPVVKWCDADEGNLAWLINHHYKLSGEYTHRYGKIHGATLHEMYIPRVNLNKRPKTFQNSAKNDSRGIDFTWIEDVHVAYRMYMQARWLNDTLKPRWTKRSFPNWYIDNPITPDKPNYCLLMKARQLIGERKKGESGSITCTQCGATVNWSCPQFKNCIKLNCENIDCLVWEELKQ